MNVLFFGNNRVGVEVLKIIQASSCTIAGICIHPETKAKYVDQICSMVDVKKHLIFDGSRLSDLSVVQAIQELRADIGVSAFFGYLVKEPILSAFKQGIVNVHPSYLPYNRGQYPNVWPIIEKTPAGATVHYMNAKIDGGAVIHQKKISVYPHDTGQTLYERLEVACVEVFRESWPNILRGTCESFRPKYAGTYHKTKDVQNIDEIQLEANVKVSDLIDLIRARTFPPHQGAFFVDQGKKYYLELKITPEELT